MEFPKYFRACITGMDTPQELIKYCRKIENVWTENPLQTSKLAYLLYIKLVIIQSFISFNLNKQCHMNILYVLFVHHLLAILAIVYNSYTTSNSLICLLHYCEYISIHNLLFYQQDLFVQNIYITAHMLLFVKLAFVPSQ